MILRTVTVFLSIVYFGITTHVAARAADIDGAWANDAAVCHKIYAKAGGSISFASDSIVSGSGFIIDKNRIRGRTANCNIAFRKEHDTRVDLIATCSTDIAVETLQFSLRIIGSNTIVREFPGVPEIAIQYERCPL
jgi:hypothetical protein